jgi:hypothetical protein
VTSDAIEQIFVGAYGGNSDTNQLIGLSNTNCYNNIQQICFE